MHKTLCVILLAPLAIAAQTRVNAARADGHSTSLMVYSGAAPAKPCPPLALISHGAGGSENGYRYLAEAMSQLGFISVVMGHAESGMSQMSASIRADRNVRRGIAGLVADPDAEQARLLDVGAALTWADGRCHAPYRVLLGHSMGAETVMLEAGARNIIGVKSPPAGQDRFDAYVAMSPEGPGVVFDEHSWNAVKKPMLVLTGTRDEAVNGGPETRQVPWADLPGNASHCQWLAVIDGATHMNFAGSGFGARRVEPAIMRTIGRFLEGARSGRCTLPASDPQIQLKTK